MYGKEVNDLWHEEEAKRIVAEVVRAEVVRIKHEDIRGRTILKRPGEGWRDITFS